MCLRFLAFLPLASSHHVFVFHIVFRTQPLLLSFRVFSLILCYRTLVLRSLTPIIICYRHPPYLYSFSSRTLVFPWRTSNQTPRTIRVTRSGPPEKVGSG